MSALSHFQIDALVWAGLALVLGLLSLMPGARERWGATAIYLDRVNAGAVLAGAAIYFLLDTGSGFWLMLALWLAANVYAFRKLFRDQKPNSEVTQ
jgi:hypothetical protein